MKGLFLDSSMIDTVKEDADERVDFQKYSIGFDFPNGLTKIPVIEECRAMNALDVTDSDNFDLMYDIMMQSLSGKVVVIYYIGENLERIKAEEFLVTDRYMNLRGVRCIDRYPVIVNWLVEFFAGYLGKKYPRSLKDLQGTMGGKEEPMKSL